MAYSLSFMRLQALIKVKRAIFQIFPDFPDSRTPDFLVTNRFIFLNKHIKQDRFQSRKTQTDKHRLNQDKPHSTQMHHY